MKFIHIWLIFLVSTINTKAQTINWKNIGTENRHILNANFGVEYGLIYGVGYGYHIMSNIPMVLNIEYSFPSGNKLTDDFNAKIGGNIRFYKVHNFQFSVKIHGIFRRYENDFVRLVNFGSDFSGIIGYYKPQWFISGEFGFDKALVTNFKHSQLYKANFPQVVDGWFEPSTGGNFYYGLQTGFSFKQNDIYLRVGKIISQDFKTSPSIPLYIKIGYNYKFKQTKNK